MLRAPLTTFVGQDDDGLTGDTIEIEAFSSSGMCYIVISDELDGEKRELTFGNNDPIVIRSIAYTLLEAVGDPQPQHPKLTGTLPADEDFPVVVREGTFNVAEERRGDDELTIIVNGPATFLFGDDDDG